MRLLHLLFMVGTLFMTSQNGQVYSPTNKNVPQCCQSKCGTLVAPAPANILDIVKESPNYVQVETPTIYTNGLDNVCHTFIQNDDTSYTFLTGLRYSNGSCEIQKYTGFDLSEYCGVTRFQNLARDSSSCTFIYDEVYLGSACPRFRVYYRNYVSGPCEILGNISKIQAYFVHGDSSSREISDYCKSQVATVANSQQLRGTQIVALPNQPNRSCVTQFNGASCVNADKVMPQDSIKVPDTGTSF